MGDSFGAKGVQSYNRNRSIAISYIGFKRSISLDGCFGIQESLGTIMETQRFQVPVAVDNMLSLKTGDLFGLLLDFDRYRVDCFESAFGALPPRGIEPNTSDSHLLSTLS
jgi:hypothetical protein